MLYPGAWVLHTLSGSHWIYIHPDWTKKIGPIPIRDIIYGVYSTSSWQIHSELRKFSFRLTRCLSQIGLKFSGKAHKNKYQPHIILNDGTWRSVETIFSTIFWNHSGSPELHVASHNLTDQKNNLLEAVVYIIGPGGSNTNPNSKTVQNTDSTENVILL